MITLIDAGGKKINPFVIKNTQLKKQKHHHQTGNCE